ncbi:hypothetical protein [Polyangium sp. y55x31]|uniref:hypothetical protein n=1 Tax=Polyangium sp. y55x31 TaxID=3042688 RepID=UPI0024831192|nr:hypothetical protein [Polyangium sp. y55x31]MDI1475570.1 hypothetical protein [Polyangium sp. y55x31]
MTPVHHSEDVWYLLRQSPYLQLARARSAVPYLRRHLHAASVFAPVLGRYPSIRCERLEFFYLCLQSLGALDRTLFVELTSHYTWRGVVWAAWLAAIAPAPHYLDPLRRARPNAPQNTWIVDVALHAIEGGGPAPEPLAEGAACAQAFRDLLAPLPRPFVPLRRSPSEKDLDRLRAEQEEMRDIYRSEGADAARRFLAGTLHAEYVMPYPKWARAVLLQNRPPPAHRWGLSYDF